MKSTTELKALKKFGPGHFIKEQLKIRNMSETAFSDLLGIPSSELTCILKNNKEISGETACLLAKVFDTSAEYWLNLDSSYKLWLEEN